MTNLFTNSALSNNKKVHILILGDAYMTISYNQLIQNYNHFTIIDIRQPDEIECTLKNAINIPMNELTNNFNNYLKNNINYVLICHNGSRSLATAIFLRKYNYQVYSLENGIIGIY